MTALVIVVDKGSGAPETIIEECLEVFKRWFDNVDPVISKGEGNYETLHWITPGLKKLRERRNG